MEESSSHKRNETFITFSKLIKIIKSLLTRDKTHRYATDVPASHSTINGSVLLLVMALSLT